MGTVVRLLGKTGMRLVMPRVMRIMFGGKFLDDPSREDERRLWRERGMANHRVGITRALRGVIERKPVLGELDRIACPTLVMVGDQDVATVPEKAERIRAAIRGARLVIIPGAGHTSSVEEPVFVNRVLTEFLARMAAPARV
jgi:pimeloyl-ACP methyl ester carboxylesterase